MNVTANLDPQASLDAMWRALPAVGPGAESESEIRRVGNLAQWFDNAPYGPLLASGNTGTTTVARQFIGQYSDPSGLDYLNARYYNSAQGQFITQDPVFIALGSPTQVQQIAQQQQNLLLADPQTLNAYSYGRDNPVTLKDPNGAFIPFIVALAAVFETYSWAQGSVDSYNYYNMNIKYADVTSQQDKNDAKLKLGFDAVSELTGQGLERAGLEVSGLGLSILQTGQDALDTYGGSVYNYLSDQATQGSKLSPSISLLTGSWTSLPTAVQQGSATYYRNSSGLLSSTPQSTVSSQTNSSKGSQGGGAGSTQSQQGYNILPGQFNPFIPH
jgi:RHS repeat-associated protein